MTTELHTITSAWNHDCGATHNHFCLEEPWLQSYTQSLQSAWKVAESCSCYKFSDALWTARTKQKALYLRLKMERQIFLHGAATYPKFLLCLKEQIGRTQMRWMASQKKKLSLQKKTKTKNLLVPTKYTSYFTCLQVLKRGQNTWKQSSKYLRVGTLK